MEETKTKKLGRPVEFHPDYIKLVRDIRSRGYSISKFCSVVGISRDSFYRWKKEYPAFKEACDIAEEDSKAFFEELAVKGSTYEIKVNAALLKDERDRQHGSVKVADAGKTEINIGNMNVLEHLSQDELKQKIEARMKNLKLIPQVTHEQ